MTDLDPTAIMARHSPNIYRTQCMGCDFNEDGRRPWPCLEYRLAKGWAEAQKRAERAERERDENLELAQREARERVLDLERDDQRWADPLPVPAVVGHIRAALSDRCLERIGSRPSWMSPDQYDQCYCQLPKGHGPGSPGSDREGHRCGAHSQDRDETRAAYRAALGGSDV